MKPVKKILALILAGVMALAMLTGCGKATSPDRAVAESVVDWLKYACSQEGNKNEISVSYQIPELRRDIVPLFDTNWMSTTDDDELDGGAVISGTTTVTQALQQRLSNYNKDTSCTVFYATDVTDCAGFVSGGDVSVAYAVGRRGRCFWRLRYGTQKRHSPEDRRRPQNHRGEDFPPRCGYF